MTNTMWADWAAARPASDQVHLDSAAAGRSSIATLEAVAAHARLEAEQGGYVAEGLAEPQLSRLLRDLAEVLGAGPDDVALVESAMAALETLVRAWPLPEGATVLVAASEWGPNVEVLEHHGLTVEALPVDADGVVELEKLERRLSGAPADVVLVDQVAAHRGLVQPAAEILALAREHGVPVWLDAAQSVGHVVVPPGADAVVATSRKWLTGPRGVGMLAVAPKHHPHLRVRRAAKHPGWSELQLLQPDEAHIAGRVGLGVAVREFLDHGPDLVAERLLEVGRMVREMATGLDGWDVVHPGAPAGATTALRATAGQDVQQTCDLLLREHRILTTVSQPWRAPREADGATESWLRLSPHVDLTSDVLEQVARVLTEV